MFRRAFILSAATLVAVTLHAQPGPGMAGGRSPDGSPGGRHPRVGRMMENLNLTDQQEQQMQKLRLEFAKARTQTAARITAARLDLAGVLMADAPDRAAIEKGLKGISDLQHQQKLNFVDHLFAVRAILTPEQQNLWKKHMAEALRGDRGMRDGLPGMRHDGSRGRWDDGE
jgi:Spy/CpxP family protein refolding chaperone